jgi:hypothetical protein
MKFINIQGIIQKARRFVSSQASVQDEEVRNPSKLAEILRGMSAQLSGLEALVPSEGLEFEVNVGELGSPVTMNHGFGVPVRWWVTAWLNPDGGYTPMGSPWLVQDASSDLNTLVLRSYMTGRAVVRIEPAQSPLTSTVLADTSDYPPYTRTGSATTTALVATTVIDYPIPAAQQVALRITFFGFATTGAASPSGSHIVDVTARRIGTAGVSAVVTASTVASGTAPTIAASGNNVRVSVTPASATSTTWTAQVAPLHYVRAV